MKHRTLTEAKGAFIMTQSPGVGAHQLAGHAVRARFFYLENDKTMNKRRISWVAALMISSALLLAAAVETPTSMSEDEKAVRAVIQRYFDGIIQYDEAALREAFHPDAVVIGLNKAGEIEREPFQEWVLYTRGKAPDPTGRNNTIVHVDIDGTAAVVKTDLNWPSVRYIDYLSLMKSQGEWRIVNKIFHRGEPVSR